jgi:hypothetical protein
VADRLTGDVGVEQNHRKHWVVMPPAGAADPIEHIDYQVEVISARAAGGRTAG